MMVFEYESVIKSTILITALIVVAIVIGFLATGGVEQKLLRRIYILLNYHQARLGPMECFTNRAICLSEDEKHLFFIRKTAFGFEHQHVNLSIQINVMLVKSMLDVTNDWSKVESISLCFKPIGRHQSDSVLCIFDHMVDKPTKNEDQIAQRWISNISPLLSKSFA